MAGPVDELRGAGFSDDEIAAWTTERRNTLSDAGFAQNEIDAYFVGGVTVPEKLPSGWTEEQEFLSQLPKPREGGLMQTIPQGIEALSSEEGRGKLWGAVKQYPFEFLKGMVDTFKLPGEVRAGRVNLSTEEGLDQAIGFGMLVAGGRLSKLPLSSRTSGFGVVPETWEGFRDSATLYRVKQDPVTGEIAPEQIGPLPQSEDFANAARLIGGEDAPMALQEKMLRLWQEKGIHPAELADDVARDPVLHQKLLSADPEDIPFRSETVVEINGEKTILRDGKIVDGAPLPQAAEITHRGETIIEINGERTVIRDGKVVEGGGGGKKPPAEPPAPPPEGSYEAAQKKVLDRISVGEHTRRDWSIHKVYTELIDDLHPIKRVSEDAYQAARLTRGMFGKAEQFLERGTFDFKTLENNGKPLKEILEPVADDMKGLRAYVAARRDLELQARGIETGFDPVTTARVAGPEGAKYAKAAQELTAYQNRLLAYLKESGVLTDGAFDAMVEAGKNYVPFYRVMTPEQVPGSKGLGPGNPVKRLKGSEREIVDPIESIIKNTYAYISIAERTAAGIKLVEALEAKGFKVVTERAKPKADADLAEYLREQGVTKPDELTEFIKAGMPDDGTTISAWRDGKRVSVKVDDPELVRAFRGLDQESVGLMLRFLALPAKGLRAGVTVTPDFIGRNVIGDFISAFINTKGAIFHPIDTAKGLKSAITKDAHFESWVKAGGANAEMVALDRRYLQQGLSELNGQTGLMERAWNVISFPVVGPYRALRAASELAEQATRIGEFRKLSKGKEGREALQGPAYSSREVTLDFARKGASTRAYNMITAFANAQIQGVDRMVRAFKDQPVTTTTRAVAGITVPTILLWWANKDNQRYQDLPQWQKDMFWIFPTDKWENVSELDAAVRPDHMKRQVSGQWQVNNGSIYRIRKPFELGMIFGTLPERVLESWVRENPDAFKNLDKTMIEALTPNLTPTLSQPLVEQYANRSTFTDRTLIPAYLEKQLPEYQFTPYTTELSKALGSMFAAFPGMRERSVTPGELGGSTARALSTPILIENYVRAWTGGMGMYALNAADVALRKAGVLPDPVKPTDTLADIPFVKAFVVRYPSASAQVIQDFYDESARNKRFFDTWQAKAREGDPEAVQKIADAGGPQMFLRLDAMQRTLGEQSKLVRDVYKNPNIKPDEKRQLIDSIYFAMIQVARAGRDAMRAAKTSE